MDLNKKTRGLIPVSTSELFVGKTINFHPEGLFSETIFGALDTADRRLKYSYINLNCKILHPAIRGVIWRLQRNLLDFVSTQKKFELTKEGDLVETENGSLSGFSKFIEIFDKINWRGDTKVRTDMINMIKHYHKEKMLFIDKCLVIPPAYRKVEFMDDNTVNIAPMNNLYIELIKLTEQIKPIQEGVMFDILCYKLFLKVFELYVYLSQKVTKKEGIIRSSILGKRVDFSARAVISGAADELKIDEIGVPFSLLVKLFEPFILHVVLNSDLIDKKVLADEMYKYNELDLNAFNLRKLFSGISKRDQIPPKLEELIVAAVNVAIQDKIVLAKRDPSLHTESVQAFKPVLVIGNTIKLNPFTCESVNGDFDGDQMALYVPITKEAIEEAKTKMISYNSKNGIGQITAGFSKDIVMGIYYLTMNPDKDVYRDLIQGETFESIIPSNTGIIYKGIKTTAGRILFNNCLPVKLQFINESVNKKKLIKIATNICNNFTRDEYKYFCDQTLKLSFKYGTIESTSFSFDDFKIPANILQLKEKLNNEKDLQKAQQIIDKMTKMLQEYTEAKKTNIGQTGLAGGLKGGYDQARQILVAKGLISDPSGKVLDPISQSFAEGLDNKTFFMSGAGSRSGIVNRVLNTSETGYLSRQLVFVCQRVEMDPKIRDCRTQRQIQIKVTPDIAKRLKGRFVINRLNNIIPFDEKSMLNHVIRLRSPVYCLTKKICPVCYGMLFAQNKSVYIGTTAATVIGERFTQMIMRTFHTGGAVNVKSIDIMKMVESYLDLSEYEKFEKYFKQDSSNNLICAEEGKIVVDKNEYLEPDEDIIIEEDVIKFAYGYFKLQTKDESLDLALDTYIEINLKDKKILENNEKQIIISFPVNSKVFSAPPTSDNFLDMVKIFKHLFSGKKPWKTPSHFLFKIYDMMKDLSEMDLVHLEVLVSQLLRDKGNPMYPARLNKNYSPIIVSLKDIPSYESWLSSLSFENFNKSVTNGLLYDSDIGESVLEKVVMGNL
jgi:DNA-directed RNA polymerase beta' subunit